MSAIYLVRHGQASFGARDYDALSALGHRQAEIVGGALRARDVVATHVICGTMKRHRETAHGCLTALGAAPQWDEDAAWNEYDHEALLAALDSRFAQREGMAHALSGESDPRKAFHQLFERALTRWTSGEHADYPETWAQFCERVAAGLRRVVARVGRGETALVFTSGGPIGAVAKLLLELSDAKAAGVSTTLTNASLTKLIAGRQGVRLSSLNEHGHLETAQRDLVSYR
jgi:broad specificity phosphatase PhoE